MRYACCIEIVNVNSDLEIITAREGELPENENGVIVFLLHTFLVMVLLMLVELCVRQASGRRCREADERDARQHGGRVGRGQPLDEVLPPVVRHVVGQGQSRGALSLGLVRRGVVPARPAALDSRHIHADEGGGGPACTAASPQTHIFSLGFLFNLARFIMFLA